MKNNIAMIIRNADYKDFGGGERFPIILSLCLKKQSFNSFVVSRSASVIKFASLNNVHYVKGLWWSKQNWSGWRIVFTPIYLIWQIVLYIWYLALIIQTKTDIVHVQSKDDFIAATLAGKTLNKKVIWTDHADLKHIFQNLYVWYKNPIGKLVYLCSLATNAVVVVSKEEQRLIFKNIKNKNKLIKKIKLIYNGVPDSKRFLNKEENTHFNYGLATRLVVDKGFSEVIEAFKLINKKYQDTRLIIVGTGPDEDLFKKQTKQNKNVIFTGHSDDPYEAMINFDVFIHPTRHESFSMAIVEASMLGLPIIATNVGGNPEIIINHKTGLLVNVKDVESLYRAMEELYKNNTLRDKLGKAARKQYLEKFNFDDIVKNQYIPLYEK